MFELRKLTKENFTKLTQTQHKMIKKSFGNSFNQKEEEALFLYISMDTLTEWSRG